VAARPDYYKVLGVGRDADEQAIRKAYKQLALKYHPDRNPDDKSAEAKFKEISEAYAVLSNPEARKKYDTFGHQGPGAGGFDFSGFDFRNMRGSYSGGGQSFFGSFGDIFSEIFGGRGRGGGASMGGDPFGAFTGAMRGRDLLFRMQIDFMLAIEGGVTQINIPQRGSVSVRIPAGVDTGQKIRLRGKGEAGPNGSAAGDMIIELEVKPHPHFKREGHDLRIQVPITIAEAVLGGRIQVPTLGGQATITLPAGTQSGQVFRLKGRGVRTKNAKGDLYVAVQITVPTKIDEKSRMLIETFAKENPMQPRKDLL